MITDNPSDFISHFPPLREEVERTLRLMAWKDETFRQELIADPKGVVERLFPQYLPDGKVPEQVTYKVIQEDQYTHHIVLPLLPYELLTPTTKNASDFISQLPPLREEVEKTFRLRAWKDEAFRQELIIDPKSVIERLFPQCFPDGKVPEQITYKVIQEDQYTYHIVLPSLPDQFLTPEVPEEQQLQLIANMGCSDWTFHRRTENRCSLYPNCMPVQKHNVRPDSKHDSDESHSSETKPKKPLDLIKQQATMHAPIKDQTNT